MPKRKKRHVPYGNLKDLKKIEEFIENWTVFKDQVDGQKIFSYLIRAEADSLIQIIISEDKVHDGIYHLTNYEFKESKTPELVVKDFDVIDSGCLECYNDFESELLALKPKYLIEFKKHEKLKENPFYIKKDFPLLAIG